MHSPHHRSRAGRRPRRSDRFRALAGRVLVVSTVLSIGWVPTGVPSAGAAPGDTVAPGGGPDPVGQWPLHPRPAVVARFDPPDSRWGPGHRGVDLRGSLGQPVRAALPGRVSFAGPLAGRGVLVVDHGATRTTYEPVLAATTVGEQVAAGQVIGVLTAVQSHCFPASCLHWGWIADPDVYLDPLRLVGGPAPVRLLPLWQSVPTAAAGIGRLFT